MAGTNQTRNPDWKPWLDWCPSCGGHLNRQAPTVVGKHQIPTLVVCLNSACSFPPTRASDMGAPELKRSIPYSRTTVK